MNNFFWIVLLAGLLTACGGSSSDSSTKDDGNYDGLTLPWGEETKGNNIDIWEYLAPNKDAVMRYSVFKDKNQTGNYSYIGYSEETWSIIDENTKQLTGEAKRDGADISFGPITFQVQGSYLDHGDYRYFKPNTVYSSFNPDFFKFYGPYTESKTITVPTDSDTKPKSITLKNYLIEVNRTDWDFSDVEYDYEVVYYEKGNGRILKYYYDDCLIKLPLNRNNTYKDCRESGVEMLER